jgi:hypothetical protein
LDNLGAPSERARHRRHSGRRRFPKRFLRKVIFATALVGASLAAAYVVSRYEGSPSHPAE